MNLAIGAIDLTVLCGYTLAAVMIGLWMGRGQRDLSDYLLGGRNLPWWAILGSIVATETSTATFLSVPGVAFAETNGDLRFLQLAIGYIVGRVIIVFLLLPLYFRGQLYTAYQVLHERFGGATKKTASLIFLVTRNLGDGLRLFLTAIALEHVLGWSLAACVIAIGLVTIIYTVFGGMKSVVWNDCLQMLIYIAGGLLAGAVILGRLPEGWHSMQSYAVEHDKFQVFDFRFVADDPFTFWAGLIGGMFLTLGTHGTDQMMVQRYLCARSQREAGRALVASGLAVLVQFALFLLLGVGLACYYDLIAPGRTFERADRVFATFIVEEMPQNVGLIGLLLAAVFAAAMSTLSSSLNSSASAVVNDFCGGSTGDGSSARKLIATSRICTIVFGLLQIGIGIAAQKFSTSVVSDALAIAGFSAGLLLGVFCLGVLTKRVGEAACLVGLVLGLVTLLSVQFVLPKLQDIVASPWFATVRTNEAFALFWDWSGLHQFQGVIAWPWFAMIGAVTTFLGGLVASRVLPRGPSV